MTRIRCILIEDEKPAQEVLNSFIHRVESLECVGIFDDGLTALEFLKDHEVDLLFLDIQIPYLNGIEFLRILKHPPQVIITSAYSQYAIEAFDLDVRDYLMKPISFERFLKAVNRVTPANDGRNVVQISSIQQTPSPAFAFFNVNKTMVRVQFSDILYVESMREYVYIHTARERIITKLSITEMEKMLGQAFLRIHRSFIINQAKVSAFNAEEVFIDKISLPIGTNFKKLVAHTFSNQVR
ncbi:MAG: LytTR family DNA-binding domain-containing protein [Cyclobacteriaceae bacterium]|nr:LytTR family DNA-binding domain-containing protein [Cyclobacteriaceae bacterium]